MRIVVGWSTHSSRRNRMRRTLSMIASLSLMVSLSLTAISGQEPGPPAAQAKGQAKAKAGEPAKEKRDATKAAADEEPVVTHHQVHIDGQELKYTATAGLMPIKDARGEVEARIFYMAY